MPLILIIKTILSLIIIMYLINRLIILRIIIVDDIRLNSFHMLKRFTIILASIQIIWLSSDLTLSFYNHRTPPDYYEYLSIWVEYNGGQLLSWVECNGGHSTQLSYNTGTERFRTFYFLTTLVRKGSEKRKKFFFSKGF